MANKKFGGFRPINKSEFEPPRPATDMAPDLFGLGMGASACGKGGAWSRAVEVLQLTKLRRMEPSLTMRPRKPSKNGRKIEGLNGAGKLHVARRK